jgi:NitT/TauT family transport system ATP-binding protein
MDEPLSALDEMTREQLCMDIQRIQQERHKTIVLVTHNVREAVCLGDRVALFSPRPGRVRDIFTVDLIRPRDLNSVAVTEQALGISAALKGRLAEVEL